MSVPSYALVQVDQKLYQVKPDGTQLEITMPSGVTVSSYLPVRASILNRRLVLTNGVSRNVQIDANLIVRLLQPVAPATSLSAAVGAAGNLTGTYYWKYTHAIVEGDRVIAESDFSPISGELALTADQASLTSIDVSSDPHVNARRIYRTADGGGSEFFLLTTLMDNTTTSYTDNSTDESLDLFPAEESIGPAYGTEEGTRLKLITTWKDRLWAVPDLYPDRVHFSGNRIQYGWNEDYFLVAGAEGTDFTGVTALAPRKNELFVGKKRSLHKITGDSVEDFGLTDIPSGIGVWAPDSVVIVRDSVYFLAEDGVYRWDGRLTNLTVDRLHTWFNEGTAAKGGVFNLALLERAFAHYNQKLDAYELYLPSTDSLTFDRWVSLDLQTGEWFGPHKTGAFTPTCATTLDDANGRQRPVVGASNGGLYLKNASSYSDAGTAIDFEATTSPLSQGDPQVEKFWGELEVHHQAESAGTLTVRAKVGDLEAPQGTVAVISVTRVGSVVTVTTNGAHRFGTGQAITIAGATGLSVDYNGIWEIVRTGTTTFTFDIGTATPETPANGTITALLPVRGDISCPLDTYDRHRLGRLGVGRFCQLTFKNAEADQNVEIRGFEIDPVNVLGRR